MPRKPAFGQVLQFKITLLGIDPPVWRRILVPDTYSFWDLHVAIQDAMGWTDSHLHVFRLSDPDSGTLCDIGIPDEDDFDDMEYIAGWEIRVTDWVSPGDSIPYEYDFGDSWEHLLEFESVLPREEGVRYPACVAGERACPPEDCGGVWGYENLREIIRDPHHEEHESTLEWLGGGFDSERFEAKKVSFDDPKERWDYAFGEL
jgi:hypothetical protein